MEIKAQVLAFIRKHYPEVPANVYIGTDGCGLDMLQDEMPEINAVAEWGVDYDQCTGDTAIAMERTTVAITADNKMLMLYYGDNGTRLLHTEPLVVS